MENMNKNGIVGDLLYGGIYNSFIEEGVKRSDTFSLDVYWPGEFFFTDLDSFLTIMPFSETLYHEKRNHEKVIYEKEKQIFEEHCIPFLKKLEPYLLKPTSYSEDQETYYYKATEEAIEILKEPACIAKWGYPYYPDNLCFSNKRDGFWFSSTQHSGSYELIPRDKEDRVFWMKMGIAFLISYKDIADLKNVELN